jgi:cation:H+ antiporter
VSVAALIFAFALSGTAVVAAGTLLARGADVIAARTGLGGVWVGSVFLALATSLPEIVTDIVAVRIGAVDLAAGDLFGSSMANMLILAVISLLPVGAGLFRKAALDHALYASLAIVLTCIAAAAILVPLPGTVFGVGVGSIVLLAAYAFGSHGVFVHSTVSRAAGLTVEMSDGQNGARPQTVPSLRYAIVVFAMGALIVLIAAPQFARSAEALAVITGLGRTFVGTWLVGLSTSLPELVTSIAAVRLRAYDLAVGNLFGSNALNMTIFALLDAVHGSPVLSAVQPAHAISALAAVILMAVAMASLVFRAQGWQRLREPSGVLIVALYVIGLWLVLRAT